MLTSNQPAVIDNETGFIINETDDEIQTIEEIFGSQENPQKTGNLISTFVDSYTRHKNTLPLDVWLEQEFSHYEIKPVHE